MTWELIARRADDDAIDDLLADGWEPFAVTFESDDHPTLNTRTLVEEWLPVRIIHFRRTS